MSYRKDQFIGIAVHCIVMFALFSAGTIWAGSAPTKVSKQNAIVKKKVVPITTEYGELEIVTDLSGKHFWQVPVKNTSNHDGQNLVVFVTVEGFRKEDKVRTVGKIDHLKAGHTAYARAELPNFEGMHLMRMKIGGTTRGTDER